MWKGIQTLTSARKERKQRVQEREREYLGKCRRADDFTYGQENPLWGDYIRAQPQIEQRIWALRNEHKNNQS